MLTTQSHITNACSSSLLYLQTSSLCFKEQCLIDHNNRFTSHLCVNHNSIALLYDLYTLCLRNVCIITIYIWFHCRGSKETEVLQEHLEIKVKRYCQPTIFIINRLNIHVQIYKFDISWLFSIMPHISLIDLYFPRAPQDLLVIQGLQELWVSLWVF